jgi:hypothetical protein
MAKCEYSGSNTLLFVNKTPVCIAFSNEFDADREPETQW